MHRPVLTMKNAHTKFFVYCEDIKLEEQYGEALPRTADPRHAYAPQARHSRTSLRLIIAYKIPTGSDKNTDRPTDIGGIS